MTTALNIADARAGLDGVRALAGAFAERVRGRFGARVGRIRLYGSAARGDWGPGSDIDVLVTLDRVGSDDSDWLAKEAFHMGVMERGLLLQPVFMDETAFRRLHDRERSFALDVERTGIAL